MTGTNVQVLQEIQMNAQVTLDDVVNVFISRFETDAHNRFNSIQALLKTNASAIIKLTKDVTDAMKDKFVQPDQVIGRNEMFEVKLVFKSISLDWKDKTALVTTEVVSTPLNGFKIGTYHEPDQITASMPIKVTISEADLSEYDLHLADGAVLRDQLMAVNQQLQQVDRKVRQVKGEIAQRKLESMGYGELLNDPELAKLVKLD